MSCSRELYFFVSYKFGEVDLFVNHSNYETTFAFDIEVMRFSFFFKGLGFEPQKDSIFFSMHEMDFFPRKIELSNFRLCVYVLSA